MEYEPPDWTQRVECGPRTLEYLKTGRYTGIQLAERCALAEMASKGFMPDWKLQVYHAICSLGSHPDVWVVSVHSRTGVRPQSIGYINRLTNALSQIELYQEVFSSGIGLVSPPPGSFDIPMVRNLLLILRAEMVFNYFRSENGALRDFLDYCFKNVIESYVACYEKPRGRQPKQHPQCKKALDVLTEGNTEGVRLFYQAFYGNERQTRPFSGGRAIGALLLLEMQFLMLPYILYRFDLLPSPVQNTVSLTTFELELFKHTCLPEISYQELVPNIYKVTGIPLQDDHCVRAKNLILYQDPIRTKRRKTNT